eukprot:jgi/Botrbrau1/17331/Bobra.0015s0077.1
MHGLPSSGWMECNQIRQRMADTSTHDLPSSGWTGWMEINPKRQRRTDASTQNRPLSGAYSRSPGLPQWDDLPEPLQWHVLRNQGLSLRDLAKLAPEGKVFEEVCLEFYEAEVKWLVETTISTFGEDLIGAAAHFLCCQDIRCPTVAAHRTRCSYDIRKGDVLPAYFRALCRSSRQCCARTSTGTACGRPDILCSVVFCD